MAKEMPENKDLMNSEETKAEETSLQSEDEIVETKTPSVADEEFDASIGAVTEAIEEIKDAVANGSDENAENVTEDAMQAEEVAATEDVATENAEQTQAPKTLKSIKAAKNKNNTKASSTVVPVQIERRPDAVAAIAENQKKTSEKKEQKGKNKTNKPKRNIFKSMWKGIKGIISELKKVTWAKPKKVFASTGVVIAFVFIFLVILFVFDYVLFGLLSLLMGNGWVNIFG
ncbi:MAG: preprotein translocase subunit SecE [Christensenellales bacterium]